VCKSFAIRSLVVVTCASALVAVGASNAAAVVSPPSITVGPIKASHGFSLTLIDATCSAKGSKLTIEFSKGNSASLAHQYLGGPSQCKLSRKLASGSLSGRWGGLANVKLAVRQPGKVIKAKTAPGCTGSGGIARSAVVTGTLKIAIHPGVFGKVSLHEAKASLNGLANVNCATPGSTGITVYGTFGPVSLSASQPGTGPRSVLISENGAKPASGISDNFTLAVKGGTSVFNAAPDLSSATIGGAAPFLSGSLAFTGLPACVGSPGARNGSFGGTLVAHDPVLGTLTLVGASATTTFIALGSAFPGACNGPNAQPATAKFTNLCSGPGICSAAGTTTDQFYDESDPGTQGPIVSEVWSFGDGSAPVSIPSGSTVTHAYTKAGTYTVTLTMTDGQGVQHAATGTSYIG
jgi:hypothetical protein